MYVEFLAYLENRRCPQSLQDKIAAFAPDFDLHCYVDVENDERGEYARFWMGDDDDSNLLDEDATADQEAVDNSETYCVRTYIELLKLKDAGEIMDCWLQNGWQFGKRPDMHSAIEWLNSLTIPEPATGGEG